MNDERMNGSFLPSSVPRVVAHSSLRPSITAYEISTGKILNHKLCLRYVRYLSLKVYSLHYLTRILFKSLLVKDIINLYLKVIISFTNISLR